MHARGQIIRQRQRASSVLFLEIFASQNGDGPKGGPRAQTQGEPNEFKKQEVTPTEKARKVGS
jgi:hypothetical protein